MINDQIRNPLAVIVALADMEGGTTNEKILFQAKEINRIITQLDIGWLESEKIREFLWKHYLVSDVVKKELKKLSKPRNSSKILHQQITYLSPTEQTSLHLSEN
jgi:hypothetical protein